MKKVLVAAAIALLFSACTKEHNQPVKSQPDPIIKIVSDSVSMNVDGVFYTYNLINNVGLGNSPANLKLDSVDKAGQRHFSGSPDSLMFTRFFSVFNDSDAISFVFFRRFAKNQLTTTDEVKNTTLLAPGDAGVLFEPGSYAFPLDYEQKNAHDGVAISVSHNKLLTSYDQTPVGFPTVIAANAQQNAQFKIISSKKEENGYLIEAIFSMNLFERDGTVHKAENGYIRIHI